MRTSRIKGYPRQLSMLINSGYILDGLNRDSPVVQFTGRFFIERPAKPLVGGGDIFVPISASSIKIDLELSLELPIVEIT